MPWLVVNIGLSASSPSPFSIDFTGSSAFFSNGFTECCDMVNNVERVVVPSAPASIGTREYTVRVMAYDFVEEDKQVRKEGGPLRTTVAAEVPGSSEAATSSPGCSKSDTATTIDLTPAYGPSCLI